MFDDEKVTGINEEYLISRDAVTLYYRLRQFSDPKCVDFDAIELIPDIDKAYYSN